MTKVDYVKEQMEMYRVAYATAMFDKKEDPDEPARQALESFKATFEQDV